MHFYSILVLIFSSISTSLQKSSDLLNETCFLPTSCKHMEKNLLDDSFICNKLYAKISNPKKLYLCQSPEYIFSTFEVTIADPDKTLVLNNSFELNAMFKERDPQLDDGIFFYGFKLKFFNLRGFSADLALRVFDREEFNFYEPKFVFFDSEGKIISTCKQLERTLPNWHVSKNFLFRGKHFELMAHFHNAKFSTPVCPLLFKNAAFYRLSFSYMIDSFTKTNKISFEGESSSKNGSLNATIDIFHLENFFGLRLDSRLLPHEIFKNTKEFVFDGVIRSIKNDIFGSFKRLKSISFHPVYLRDFVRMQGIDWIRGINSDIRIDPADSDSVKEKINRLVGKRI